MSDDLPCDLDLMRATAQGDETAFRTLVERHQHKVFGTIAKMLGDLNEAEDLTQRVFIRVFQAAPRYQPSAQFNTWLMTIVRNLVFTECDLRKRKSRYLIPSERLASGEGEEESNSVQETADTRQQSPSELTLQSEKMQHIDQALAALPETQRLAIVLVAYQELSYEEVARILNLSLSATKSAIFRARATLREKLGSYLG